MGKKSKGDLCAAESAACSASGKSNVVCRYRGFELLVRPDTVIAFREKKLKLAECLASSTIFSDAKKNLKAAEDKLEEEFEGLSPEEMCAEILTHGAYQSTAAERKALTDQRRAQLITHFNTHFIDPKTRLPHPATRLDAALTEAKFRVDYTVNFAKQAVDARKAIVSLIPMKERPPQDL